MVMVCVAPSTLSRPSSSRPSGMREQDDWQEGRMQSLAVEQEHPVRPWAEDGCRAFIRSLRRCCGIHNSCAFATAKGLHCLRCPLACSGFSMSLSTSRSAQGDNSAEAFITDGIASTSIPLLSSVRLPTTSRCRSDFGEDLPYKRIV